jgi:hypothetical protein
MGRANLPEARIEPRGVEGHLAKLRAEARQGSRVAGAIGVKIARALGWTAFAGGAVAVLAMITPPPRSPQLDELRRIQTDFQRQRLDIEATQRALQVWQTQQSFQLSPDLQNMRATPLPDVRVYPPASVPDWTTLQPALEEPPATNVRAAKEAHAAERAQAIEAKRAQRGH